MDCILRPVVEVDLVEDDSEVVEDGALEWDLLSIARRTLIFSFKIKFIFESVFLLNLVPKSLAVNV